MTCKSKWWSPSHSMMMSSTKKSTYLPLTSTSLCARRPKCYKASSRRTFTSFSVIFGGRIVLDYYEEVLKYRSGYTFLMMLRAMWSLLTNYGLALYLYQKNSGSRGTCTSYLNRQLSSSSYLNCRPFMTLQNSKPRTEQQKRTSFQSSPLSLMFFSLSSTFFSTRSLMYSPSLLRVLYGKYRQALKTCILRIDLSLLDSSLSMNWNNTKASSLSTRGKSCMQCRTDPTKLRVISCAYFSGRRLARWSAKKASNFWLNILARLMKRLLMVTLSRSLEVSRLSISQKCEGVMRSALSMITSAVRYFTSASLIFSCDWLRLRFSSCSRAVNSYLSHTYLPGSSSLRKYSMMCLPYLCSAESLLSLTAHSNPNNPFEVRLLQCSKYFSILFTTSPLLNLSSPISFTIPCTTASYSPIFCTQYSLKRQLDSTAKLKTTALRMSVGCMRAKSILVSILFSHNQLIILIRAMAPPPKYLIQRKLIRSIVKKVVPQRPLLPTEYFSKLTDCWKRFGIGSTKCADEEMMYNFANNEVISFKERMNNLGLREMVMQEVKRPTYHREVKGRESNYRRKFKDLISFMNYV